MRVLVPCLMASCCCIRPSFADRRQVGVFPDLRPDGPSDSRSEYDAHGLRGATFHSLAQNKSIEIVVSTYDEDIAWLSQLHVATIVYNHVGGSRDHGASHRLGEHEAALRTLTTDSNIVVANISNGGDESHAYLRYMVDRYDDLPTAIVFIHGHRTSWHQQADILTTLESMKFPKDFRYRNLNNEQEPQCFAIDLPSVPGSHGINKRDHIARLRKFWPRLESEYGALEAFPIWCTYCCGQFVVSKEAIRAHPRRFYMNLLEAAVDGDEDFKYGMEYLWLTLLDPGTGRRTITTHLMTLVLDNAYVALGISLVAVVSVVACLQRTRPKEIL